MDEDTARRLSLVRKRAVSNEYSSLYAAIPTEFDETVPLNGVPRTSFEALLERSCAPFYPEDETRSIVNAFSSPPSPIRLIPRRMYEEWSTIAHIADRYTGQTILASFPPLWQLGPSFYITCRNRLKTVVYISPRNIPVLAKVAEETQARVILTTAETAAALQSHLAKEGIRHEFDQWIIVVAAGRHTEVPELPGIVTVEHHLEPGIALGISRENKDSFEPSADYYFEVENDELLVTSLTREAFPFLRVAVGNKASYDAALNTFSFTRYE